MSELPRISIVTSSYNQGSFIARTIDSVLAQDYPNVEHIVIDGLSKDETPEILARYPHLRVVREKDSGQAEAINKGFRLATGDIWCFLNSDDTFEPGALHRVARELDPSRGRHIVMGRCRFIDEEDRFIGIEHPSAFESHKRVLEIWKGYSIPQPAVFWTPEVWRTCGPLDEKEQLVLDYDLFCRFSRKYAFHTFDQVVANYRLHHASKTQGVDDQKRLEDAIRVSHRYWGSPLSPRGAAIRASLFSHRIDRRGRAYRALLDGRREWQSGHRRAALKPLLYGGLIGPDVALHALAGPLAKRSGGGLLRGLGRLRRRFGKAGVSPQTQAWLSFHDIHVDNWVGPVYERAVDVPQVNGASAGEPAALLLEGDLAPETLAQPLSLSVTIGGAVSERIDIGPATGFSHRVSLAGLTAGRHTLVLRANCYMVPHDRWGNGDYRPLSYRLTTCTVTSAASGDLSESSSAERRG